jgi:hypothetical protein
MQVDYLQNMSTANKEIYFGNVCTANGYEVYNSYSCTPSTSLFCVHHSACLVHDFSYLRLCLVSWKHPFSIPTRTPASLSEILQYSYQPLKTDVRIVHSKRPQLLSNKILPPQ